MTNTNDFQPYAIGVGANVLTPAAWAALTARQQGFQKGVAVSTWFNTVWRQSSTIATMIAQFIADNQTGNVQDNGDLATLENQFVAALTSALAKGLVHYGTDAGSGNTITLTCDPVSPSPIKPAVYFFQKGSGNNSGAVSATVDGNGPFPLTDATGAPFASGNLLGGEWLLIAYTGSSSFRLLNGNITQSTVNSLTAVSGEGITVSSGGAVSLNFPSLTSGTPLNTDAIPYFDSTAGHHHTTTKNALKASSTALGFGRVASSSEASAGVTQTGTQFDYPWITPEQLASYVAAHGTTPQAGEGISVSGTNVIALNFPSLTARTPQNTDAIPYFDSASGHHSVTSKNALKASFTALGFGRVASSTEASNGQTQSGTQFDYPWITPEQLAAYVNPRSYVPPSAGNPLGIGAQVLAEYYYAGSITDLTTSASGGPSIVVAQTGALYYSPAINGQNSAFAQAGGFVFTGTGVGSSFTYSGYTFYLLPGTWLRMGSQGVTPTSGSSTAMGTTSYYNCIRIS